MVHAVIMAGGRGTRFWPLSRKVKAKQFLTLIGESSFLTQTIDRVSNFLPSEHIWVVGNIKQHEMLKTHASHLSDGHLLLEPVGKNTAPCIIWAALELKKADPDATMLVLPADHYIDDMNGFESTINVAVDIARTEKCIVTIGIKPTLPHTGYGYIEAEKRATSPSKVSAFHEKPDFKTAARYISSGVYYWNSGMFVWHVDTILGLAKTYLPRQFEMVSDFFNESADDKRAEIYNKIDGISVDYGIMEKAADCTYVVPANFIWSDIGSWSSISDFSEKDEKRNIFHGNVLAVHSEDNIVISDKRLISLVGVENLVVVDTEDALLVMDRDHDQSIKALVEKLPEKYT